MLHIALIVGIAYAGMAILGYLVVFPILKAGKEADRSMAAEELESPLGVEPEPIEIAPPVTEPKPAVRVARVRNRRFARRARHPLAMRRPGV